MSTRLQTFATFGLLVLSSLVLYGYQLQRPAPAPAERALQSAAQAIASTGRDAADRAFPMFVRVSDGTWAQPMAVYASALAARVLPEQDHAGRWAAVLAAALNVALIFFLGQRLTGRSWLGVVAALLLMLTPAHFAYGRLGLDAIYAVPFVLGWLSCLLVALDGRRRWLTTAAGVCLGAGTYAAPTAPVTMAAYLALTLVVLWQRGEYGWRTHAGVVAGFAVPLLGMAAWFLRHPETYPDTMGAWAIHAAHIRNPVDLARAFVNWNTLGTRASLYWDAFNPVYLFLPGGPAPGGVVRGAGVLLAPLAVPVAAGVLRIGSQLAPPVRRLLLAAIALAPLAASTFGVRHAIGGSLSIAPLLILLATIGVAALVESPRVAWRGVTLAILVAVPLQFLVFWRAYLA